MTDRLLSEKATHDLKTWPPFFDAVNSGLKTFEIRRNDRDFAPGDTLRLREYDSGYTDRECLREVSYITTFEQQPGFVVLGLVALPSADPREPSEALTAEEREYIDSAQRFAENPEALKSPAALQGNLRRMLAIIERLSAPRDAEGQR